MDTRDSRSGMLAMQGRQRRRQERGLLVNITCYSVGASNWRKPPNPKVSPTAVDSVKKALKVSPVFRLICYTLWCLFDVIFLRDWNSFTQSDGFALALLDVDEMLTLLHRSNTWVSVTTTVCCIFPSDVVHLLT